MGLDELRDSEPEAYLVRRSAASLIAMLAGLRRVRSCVIRMSIALLSLVIFVYSAGAQDNSVLTYHGDAGRSGNFVVPALTWEKARSVKLDRAFDAQVAAHLYAQPLYWHA